jgi:hypothetical protein
MSLRVLADHMHGPDPTGPHDAGGCEQIVYVALEPIRA